MPIPGALSGFLFTIPLSNGDAPDVFFEWIKYLTKDLKRISNDLLAKEDHSKNPSSADSAENNLANKPKFCPLRQ